MKDYELVVMSRECSLSGRREVLMGKGKFGIFGDGKELPQVVLAKVLRNGDFRSGYYRDQTLMMASGHIDAQQFFSAIYAHTDEDAEPMNSGRQMCGHYASRSIDKDGNWLSLVTRKNTSSDISCTAGQMPRLLGLAQASSIYRSDENIEASKFSVNGNEVAWGTIGNASTSEGMFFETVNAAGVLQVPMVVSIWDDSYGISVHQKHQSVKENISEMLSGFRPKGSERGVEILNVKGWDYSQLILTYKKADELARKHHIPTIVHVEELTQPLGHSTSGSHERYKSKERLEWEKEYDCNRKFRAWIISKGISSDEELSTLEKDIKKRVDESKRHAWSAYTKEILLEKKDAVNLIKKVEKSISNRVFVEKLRTSLEAKEAPYRRDIISVVRKSLRYMRNERTSEVVALRSWLKDILDKTTPKYSSHLYSEGELSPLKVDAIAPTYDKKPESADGRIIIRDNFNVLLKKYPELMIFGEDCGKIGDVNQGLEGLQDTYGEHRVTDTGIRETTIIGQGIGLALRGLRPIAEIQYLDYITYALATLSDDLACLHYRCAGRQKAPLIIRTRGHRLEGIFHAGSPMSGLLGFLRGIYILTPRNMTQAAGFYNTLMVSDQPALVIESLNGYRLKEPLPKNLGVFRVPVGKVEVMTKGDDITLVSYGSTLRIAKEVSIELLEVGIGVEVIDCQSLIPFDLSHDIAKSVRKTNRLIIVDEDVPGGASAYILQKILEEQSCYRYLDSAPKTLTAKNHRTAYGSDGDYFSKPNAEDIFEAVYDMMNEYNPTKYPAIR